MNVVVNDLAKQSLIDINYYNYQYSLRNAIETNRNILFRIHDLEDSPYIGRYIPEMSDKRFREIIYKSSRHSGYRIMYYISENTDTIYILIFLIVNKILIVSWNYIIILTIILIFKSNLFKFLFGYIPNPPHDLYNMH